MDLGRLLMRGIIGPLFVGHGTQKLFGWFHGHGLEGTGGFFESVGLRPGRRHAVAAGVAETTGGVLLTVGALTPLASSLISGSMVTALRKVHARNGPWVTDNGYEYTLVLIGAMFAITESGPGRPSVDAAAFPKLKGTAWALGELGAAVAGSALVTSERLSAPVEPAPQAGEAPAVEERRFVREPMPAPAEPES
jgi:putative oxidoreductase